MAVNHCTIEVGKAPPVTWPFSLAESWLDREFGWLVESQAEEGAEGGRGRGGAKQRSADGVGTGSGKWSRA